MKKHVLVGLSLMLVCFIAGGSYIVLSIQKVTNKLENVVSFHQVEFLRENLEHQIKSVQSGLLLQGSPHAIPFYEAVTQIVSMEKSATECLHCHHSPQISEQLTALQRKTDHYMKLLSSTLTISSSNERLRKARAQAFEHGESLLKNVQLLSVASAEKIDLRVKKIHRDITKAKYLLMACIVLGPIAILCITAFFLKRFTGSVNTLLSATNTLEQGNLDHRINTQSLKDEFRILAKSINGMAVSLQEERKKLATMYQLYHTMFESSGDAIIITSLADGRAGQIISANAAAARLYGYSSDELLGMDVTCLVPVGKVKQYHDRVKTVIDGSWSHQRVHRIKKDGSLISIDLSMGMLILDGQKHVLSFCKDITAQLRAEEELQRANQMALVGQMAAGLAHEIKNPLTGIKISLDVLADELELQLEDKELFVRIINEVDRMEKLLKNLLNYARPPQPQFDQVDINQLLSYSLKNAEVATAGDRNITIDFHSYFSKDLPLVEVDASQLQQISLNILLNAVDAIETEGTITVSTHTEGDDHFRIQISDTGRGISEASLKKIFTPFFTTKVKGSGLGLSICKRLIEQHSGTIEVSSHIGKGTSFTMILPLKQQNLESLHA